MGICSFEIKSVEVRWCVLVVCVAQLGTVKAPCSSLLSDLLYILFSLKSHPNSKTERVLSEKKKRGEDNMKCLPSAAATLIHPLTDGFTDSRIKPGVT